MYDINRYRSARNAGHAPAISLRFARGEHLHPIWGRHAAEQRLAVRLTRAAARMHTRPVSIWSAARTRWHLAYHAVRRADYELFHPVARPGYVPEYHEPRVRAKCTDLYDLYSTEE